MPIGDPAGPCVFKKIDVGRVVNLLDNMSLQRVGRDKLVSTTGRKDILDNTRPLRSFPGKHQLTAIELETVVGDMGVVGNNKHRLRSPSVRLPASRG